MMKARMLALLSLALGTASVALAQAPVQLKFSRVVDLTLPIESNMAPIPGLKPYLDNPSRVNVVSSITEAQREALRAEGMTLSSDHQVNGRNDGGRPHRSERCLQGIKAGDIGHAEAEHRNQRREGEQAELAREHIEPDPADQKIRLLQDLKIAKQMIDHGPGPQRLPSRRPINIPTNSAPTTLCAGCAETLFSASSKKPVTSSVSSRR